MHFFQLKTLPGYEWPPLPDAVSCQIWSTYLELDRSQWLEPAQLERRQLEQVRTLLAHCITQVPHYRETLSQLGIYPRDIQTMADFRRLPLLPRRTYQENTDAFAARKLPPGTVATQTTQTSGSSGTPTRVFQTNWVHLLWCACYLRDLEWSNIDPTGTIAVIRSLPGQPQAKDGIRNAAWFAELQPLIATGCCFAMDIGQSHRRQFDWLREMKPDYLMSYPSNLEVLAEFARREGPVPSLRIIQAMSDTLTDDAQARIEEAFGVEVKNMYSCAEAGYLASPCPAGHGLHVHAENVLLEVLDEAEQPCRSGQTGRVFITSLNNLRGPFVRYELGDEVTLGPERCPCGRGLPLLSHVQGKNYPMFRLPDGRHKNSTSVAYIIRKVGGHWQHQVVQKALDHLVVRLAVDLTWMPQHEEALRRKLQEYFEAPMRIDVEILDHLPLPASGKFQSMVVEM